MAEKMTQKQMFALIAEKCADDEMIVEFCEKKIAQLTNRKPSKRKVNPEVQERRDAIMGFLNDKGEACIVKDIADALGFSSPQVSGAIRGLVNAGLVEVVEPEKKSQPKAYKATEIVEEF